MATLRQLAQIIRLTMNGGVSNTSEPGPDDELIMHHVLLARNFFLATSIDKTEKKFMPEEAYYAEHPNLPLRWDENQEVMVLDLPDGLPFDVVNGMGLVINPIKGKGGYFVWAPRNWCDNNPEICWAEGNYVYETRGSRIVFPTMRRDEVRAVRVNVIESLSAYISPYSSIPLDISESTLRVPDKYTLLIQEKVMGYLGMGKRDMQTNFGEDGK